MYYKPTEGSENYSHVEFIKESSFKTGTGLNRQAEEERIQITNFDGIYYRQKSQDLLWDFSSNKLSLELESLFLNLGIVV